MERKRHGRTSHFNILLLLLAVAGIATAVAALDPGAWASRYRDESLHHRASVEAIATAFCSHETGYDPGGTGRYVEAWLDLDDRQAAAWGEVEQAIGAGLQKLRDTCNDQASDVAAQTAVDRLAAAERLAVAGTDVLHGIRPAFERFYVSLAPEQRDRLDGAIAQRGVWRGRR